MGNSKSKKSQKEWIDDGFFKRVKRTELKIEEKKKKKPANIANRRTAGKEGPLPLVAPGPPGGAGPAAPPPAHLRSYDEMAIERMRYQLQNDSEAFLLNNILLSVQFFENYEREVHNIKNNPMSGGEHLINEAMVRRNKHVFFADRMQEYVNDHVCYQRQKGQSEPLAAPRLFVIYDNVEASEPGDTSDYSAVLDAPFYKLRIEDCKEPGYIKLRKIEVLESTLHQENEFTHAKKIPSDDSVYTDSEKESIDSDDSSYAMKGEQLLEKMRIKLNSSDTNEKAVTENINLNAIESTNGRRHSGPIKQVSLQAMKSNISNMHDVRKSSLVPEENSVEDINNNLTDKQCTQDDDHRPRKSILKNSKRPSGLKEVRRKSQYTDISKNSPVENTMGEDTETSGYRSNSSRQTESSETESDYGYSTITEAATPKKVELKMQSNYALASGVLPEESWTPVEIKSLDGWSDDEEDDIATTSSRLSLSRNLYERYYYLNSLGFMNNFVDNFIINLGSGLGLTQDTINNALTQGASIYCDLNKNGLNTGYEIFPALIAAWPNAANPWIIRERKIIQNPRTNFSYQWPTKYMVSRAIGFGCLLVPVGFRPKRGLNPEQTLQWKILFPAAERYLESCLAHSHMRCYLFALALHKTFMENETSKIGIDASHIKNHLFWECEDNYAKWPEDRLGESLRLFLKSFYSNFGQSRFPNYFIESCNDFKSIPKPLLLKLQRRLLDILESPVVHLLYSLDKVKYTKRDFYPSLNCNRLYEILTCKNPLRLLNPNLPPVVNTHIDDNDSDDDANDNCLDRSKVRDKHYQWKIERQRQIQERRKAQVITKKQKAASRQESIINKHYILPVRMEPERRRLVLEFFIPHFIAMARSSEKFDAVKQAIIYLEQAQRLCVLLSEEPSAETTATEYLDVIREKLTECQRKVVQQGGYKLPPIRDSKMERPVSDPIRKQRPNIEQIVNQDSPVENHTSAAFTFVDVHSENTSRHEQRNNLKLKEQVSVEESKL